jgi:hypothetical protein
MIWTTLLRIIKKNSKNNVKTEALDNENQCNLSRIVFSTQRFYSLDRGNRQIARILKFWKIEFKKTEKGRKSADATRRCKQNVNKQQKEEKFMKLQTDFWWKQKKSTFGAFEMKEETLRQLLNEFSEQNEAARKEDEAARKEDRDYLRRGIDDISKVIKEIKDNVINLKRRMSDTESEISKIKENGITREELSEIQRKKSEVIIFGLPELENDLKTAVLDKLNKVTPTSMEEIKFIRKIGKASNGKIQPTLAWCCSEVQQSVKSSSRGPTKSHTVLNPVSQKTNKCTRKNWKNKSMQKTLKLAAGSARSRVRPMHRS